MCNIKIYDESYYSYIKMFQFEENALNLLNELFPA